MQSSVRHNSSANDTGDNAGGFDSSLFAQLAALEERNFWFKARNELIISAIDRYFPVCASMLEIGCGTGFVLSGIAGKFPGIALTGSELFSEGLSYARQRLPQAHLIEMNAEKIPYRCEFDLIGAFDVLEHISADTCCLQQIYEALKPGGGLIVTVPQHQWLWSKSDEIARHVRRYSRRQLLAKLTSCGFEILKVTSFVSLLLPFMYLSRLRQRLYKDSSYSVLDELRIGDSLNLVFESIMGCERALIEAGAHFPAGGSLFCVASKTI